jgi:glutathione synthase
MAENKKFAGKKVLFVIDLLERLNRDKDTTLCMMRSVHDLGGGVYTCEPHQLSRKADGGFEAIMRRIVYAGSGMTDFTPETPKSEDIKGFGAIFMRKDPPVDKDFFITTLILEEISKMGVRVYNPPQTLRDHNEKLFALYFSHFIPKTAVSADKQVLREFLQDQGQIILKPIDAMGGTGVFLVQKDDPNFDVIWETLTDRGRVHIIAQEFIPAVRQGDMRVVVMNGEPFSHMLARIPKDGNIRANTAAGGGYEVRPLTAVEDKIAREIGKVLKEKGIVLAGLDIIGDRLTEINITSPTGLRLIGDSLGRNICDDLMAGIFLT